MNIAIFNGFNFHYEMFGYILYFCKSFNHHVTIYSTNENNGWKEFYKEIFNNIEWKEVSLFYSEYKIYDFIVLTTDDDSRLTDNFINNNNNIIAIDHHYTNRRNNIDLFFHIGTRPFSENYRKWGLPCYPIISSINEKKQILINNNDDSINILILGGNNDYNIERINRLSSLSKINLHIISRRVNTKLLEKLNSTLVLHTYENIGTKEMINIIKKCKYVFSDTTTNNDHINGKSMSGSIPLAFSNLCTLIISSQNNNLYNFKSVYTFDLESDEKICIDNIIKEEDIQKIYEERNILINSFHNYMNEIIKL